MKDKNCLGHRRLDSHRPLAFGILDYDNTIGWVRISSTARKAAQPSHQHECTRRERSTRGPLPRNLHRIQAAKRKAAFDRGNPIGPITWEEILHAMPDAPSKGKMTPAQIEKYMLNARMAATIRRHTRRSPPLLNRGQGTISLEDDHIIRD